MLYYFYILLFVFGLAVGSFLNVVALRYKPNRSAFDLERIGGRSVCPNCKEELTWFELIPLLSFLLQGGRCRSCKASLSLQYPLVELLSGIIFLSVPLYLQKFYDIASIFPLQNSFRAYYGIALLWIFVFLIWLLIAIIDLKHYLIPNELNILLLFLGIAILAVKLVPHPWLLPFRDTFLRHYALLVTPIQAPWFQAFLGAFAGAFFFGALVLLSRGEAMGVGDVKLAFTGGLLLGWPDIVIATMIAFVVGGIFGAMLLITGKKTLHDRLPFAPFLVVGFVLTIFLGFDLIRGYFGLFNI